MLSFYGRNNSLSIIKKQSQRGLNLLLLLKPTKKEKARLMRKHQNKHSPLKPHTTKKQTKKPQNKNGQHRPRKQQLNK
jgi:hypothetical protein